jgi:long-chain acyl-CoA synthetase
MPAMNLARHVERGALDHPERPALLFEGAAWSYAALDAQASRMAGALAGLGIGRGDRVAVWLPNCPEWTFAYLGTLKAGAIAVSLNASLRGEEAGFILADSGARALVTTGELLALLPLQRVATLEAVMVVGEGAPEGVPLDDLLAAASADARAVDLPPEAPAAIVYTSGTTGTPRGATLSHANVVFNARAKRHHLGIRPDDRMLLFLPLYHCFGQNAVLNAALLSGATAVLHRRFEVEPVLRSIERDGVTMFFGVPATFQLLAERATREEMRPVRCFFSAAAILPLATELRWREKFGQPIHQGYGLTESSPFASYNHSRHYRPGSIGTPIEGVEMRVVSVADGREVGAGAAGEIVIRGPNVMLGYWGRPEETAEVVRGGWLHTGDIGRMDEDGYFYIEDRLKDLIDVGGVNVYPAEVENVLHRHPAVAEAAVYGVPAAVLGEQVQADVVLRPEAAAREEELVVFCRARLAPVKVPARIRLVPSVPRSPTGKILKRVLRDEHPAGTEGAPRPAPSAAAILEWLESWLREQLAVAGPPRPDVPLREYGMDSPRAVLLAANLGEWLGLSLPVTLAWSHPTLGRLAAFLAAETGASPTVPGARPAPPAPAHRAPSAAFADGRAELDALSEAELATLLARALATSRAGVAP